MRKKMMLSLLFFFLTLCASAQSLIGEWVSEMQQDGAKLTFELTVKDKKNLSITVRTSLYEEDSMDMSFHLTVNGSYTVNDDILRIDFDRENAATKIDKIEFFGEAAQIAKNNPETADFVKKMMESQIDNSKDDLLKELPADGEMKIVKLTDTNLLLDGSDNKDGSDIVEFTRK